MDKRRTISGAVVAIAVIAAFVIVKSNISAHDTAAERAVSAGPSAIAVAPSPGASSARPSSSHSGGASAPTGLPAGMKLSFNGAFTGSSLDTSLWSTCYAGATTEGCTNFGNKTEVEWYTPSQVHVSGGALHLVANHEPTSGTDKAGASKEYYCRSGMVSTHDHFDFQYGYVQVVARIPHGKGLWSALWLAASNLRWPPEIDMLEHWGTSLQYKEYLHPIPEDASIHVTRDVPDLSVGWHTLGVNWTSSKITWYVDGVATLTATKHIPQQPMYFIANLADDASGPGTCSGTMLVRSVKIWTHKS